MTIDRLIAGGSAIVRKAAPAGKAAALMGAMYLALCTALAGANLIGYRPNPDEHPYGFGAYNKAVIFDARDFFVAERHTGFFIGFRTETELYDFEDDGEIDTVQIFTRKPWPLKDTFKRIDTDLDSYQKLFDKLKESYPSENKY